MNQTIYFWTFEDEDVACVQLWTKHLLDFFLIYYKVSEEVLKGDHLDGTRHLRGGRISILLKIIYTFTLTKTKTRRLSSGIVCYDTCCCFTKAHTPGHIAVSHLCSCIILRGPEICVCASWTHSGDNLPAHDCIKHWLREKRSEFRSGKWNRLEGSDDKL